MYIGAIPTPAATESRQEFTATANQTVFSTTGGTVGFCDCYLNGVKLANSDFSFDGADVTLTSGAAAGDVLAVVMRQADNALVALPITDSAGNNVLSESGGVITLKSDTKVTGGLTHMCGYRNTSQSADFVLDGESDYLVAIWGRHASSPYYSKTRNFLIDSTNGNTSVLDAAWGNDPATNSYNTSNNTLTISSTSGNEIAQIFIFYGSINKVA